MDKRSISLSRKTWESDVEQLVQTAKKVTLQWAEKYDFWYDSHFKDPTAHYKDEPCAGSPFLLLCSDGPVNQALQWGASEADELYLELERYGIYLEIEDTVTACYQLIDTDSALQVAVDRVAKWRWVCQLIEPDAADVSGDLYGYFATNPDDFHRLSPREFETLISSIFAARGWRTELGPGSADGGIDLRIWQKDPLGELLTLVQIKRYAPHSKIKLEAVAALDTHVQRGAANRGLFITSSGYLRGVKKFAELTRNKLILADATDLKKWCLENAQESLESRNRAMALDTLGPNLDEMRTRKTHLKLLVGGLRYPSFCIVLKETRTSALLLSIPSVRTSGDGFWGAVSPDLSGRIIRDEHYDPVFRAIRREDTSVTYWGRRELYSQWDGNPVFYDLNE
jgi:HJR/Mrr/RecB family endonuclease